MENKEGKSQVKRGLWKPEEDLILRNYVETYGEGNWADISRRSGLKRGGKSCRLRWKNYLRPNIKRGDMSEEEEDLIIRMHKLLGNRWSLIAGRLPGRTDNEVKNYWNTHLNKKFKTGKRKSAGSNRGTIVKNDVSSEKKQCASETHDFQQVFTEDMKKKMGEESMSASAWTDDQISSFGYYEMESPLMLSDHTICALDDFEPFLDVFPLF